MSLTTQAPKQNGTWLENLNESISRSLASRFSRRSFMGRLGKGAVAATLGSAGVALVRPEAALAASCPSGCNCACSVSCEYLPGWGQNSCPTNGYGTCACGSWCFSTTQCPSGIRRWDDCCGINYCTKNPGTGCYCVSSVNRPSCCNTKTYSGGCGDASSIVACRMNTCVSSCNITPYYCG